MSGHTPGPWKITDHFPCILEGPEGRLVGRTDVMNFMGSDYTAENKANAHLIAAAPDLLDALKRMGYQGRNGWCFCCDKDGEESTQHQGFCKTARAAIAKAEGK